MKNNLPLECVRYFLGLFSAVFGLLLMAGCCHVYTSYPLVRDPAVVKPGNPLPVGIWNSGPPYNIEARIGPDGHATVASLAWNKENERYELLATEAWLTPRSGEAAPGRGFISIRQKNANGHLIERYGLLEYGLRDKTLVVWEAQREVFRRAIEAGELEGAIYENGEDVVINTPKEKLFAYLEHPDHLLSERPDARPVKPLFFYTRPNVLQLANGNPEEITGAAGLDTGGSATMKEPTPLTLVTSIKAKSVGLFSPPPTPVGPDGLAPKPTGQPTLQTNTTRIPAVFGTSFGACFVVDGSPAEAKVALTAIWRFPDPGLADPSRAHPWYREEYLKCFEIGKPAFQSFTFRDDWALVPGVWTMELWQGERRLLVQDFEVYRPTEPANNAAAEGK